MLSFEHERRDHVVILRIRGTLDALTAPDLKREIDPLLAGREPSLVFDLSGVDLVDSSGVGAVVAAFKRVRGLRGDLRLAGLQGQPREIFGLLRLDRAFEIRDNIEDATSDLLAK